MNSVTRAVSHLAPTSPGRPGARAVWVRALGLLAPLLVLGAGCAAHIGDPCTSNQECAYGHSCDLAPPGGYCLVVTCKPNSCAAEAWCASYVVGGRTQSYCLRKCQEDGDCRDGYRCRFDLGAPGGVCYTAAK